MYRFKLKEIEVGDTAIRGGKKSTVSAIDDATGRIEWDIVDAADFSSVYKALSKAKDFLSDLEKEGKAKDDVVIDGFAEDIAKLFNAFRTHVRKAYPKEYERVSRLKEEEVEEGTFHGSREIAIYDGPDGETYIEKRGLGYYGYNNSFDFEAEDKAELKHKLNSWGYRLVAGSIDEGEGIGYLTPNAFGKKKKNVYTSQYGYKLVPKKIKGSGMITKQLFEYSNFQEKRINGFDGLEDKLNSILPLLSNAKNETAEYYNENPGSYAIVVPTDYILEILDEVELKLKQVQDK